MADAKKHNIDVAFCAEIELKLAKATLDVLKEATTKYILTDPCYILPIDIWRECCHKVGNQKEFNAEVTKALQEFTGNNEARAVDTGGGDWVNFVKGNKKKIITSRFTADSGMACFCAFNAIVEKALKDNQIQEHCFAILELEGDVSFVCDLYPNDWTEMSIFDKKNVISTLSREELNGEWCYD